ncbi:MAG: hypothetical protein SPL99_07125 [Catonella sp.]|jgi:hypothetical protein|nr:hypothetical protein [Catonella sp.]MDY6356751.1 hypothetical protein [Catonella sp.]
MKSKSIKSYLVRSFSISSAVIFILLFVITAGFVYNSFLAIKSNGVKNTLDSADENLTAQIETMYASARAIAADKEIYTTSTTFEQKKDKRDRRWPEKL